MIGAIHNGSTRFCRQSVATRDLDKVPPPECIVVHCAFLLVVFSRLLLDGIAGIKFLVELRPIHTWAIIKAHLSVYRNFYKFLQKRKNLQKKYEYNLHTSVVWQYFVLGRKKFKNLR